MLRRISSLVPLLLALFPSCERDRAMKDMAAINRLSLLKESFEKDIKGILKRDFRETDTISKALVMDTLYSFSPYTSKYQVAVGQFHTSDEKMTYGIIGIGNFSDTNPPTFLMHSKFKRQYIVDSVKHRRDSLLIFGRISASNEVEKFRLEFNTMFDQNSDPWNYEVVN